MAEGRESSVLFSLRSLMDIESDRVNAEERERAAREQQEREALERQRRLELEAERQRIIGEEQRRAREQAARDAAAAHSAIAREAALTRARIETQAQAQREALEKQREHELRMAAISEGSRRRRDRLLLFGSNAVLLTILVVACGIYFGKVAPEVAEREAQLNRLVAAEGERADAARRLARQAGEEVAALEVALDRKQSELREAESRSPRGAVVETKPDVPRTPRREASPPPTTTRPCPAGDPLCEDPNMR